MFEIPGSDIMAVRVTSDVVLGKSTPVYIRGSKEEKNRDYENTEDKERAVNT